MTREQNFLKLQLDDIECSRKWKEIFLELLPKRRMIILYPTQKSQIANISRLDNDEVYSLAKDINNPSITLSLLEKTSIDLHFS